jgi:demethylmenaquinone methyltransferase/2-methoxy-6-polyprenyl-1,4-benzoquinol methylase
MDKSPQKIQRMFDSIAPRYDFLNHFLSFGMDYYWRSFAVRQVLNTGTPDGDILDVCCGTGDLTFALYKRCPARRYYGIDFSEAMIVQAKRKTVRYIPASDNIVSDGGAASFATGDALHLPFEENRFAAVTNAFGLRNVSDTQGGLAEMVRVCKAGGTVAILDFSMPAMPVLRQLYRFYFTAVLPRIGERFVRNSAGGNTQIGAAAYRYLPESVSAFDSPQRIAERMRQLGADDIRIRPLTFGIAALVWGKKRTA